MTNLNGPDAYGTNDPLARSTTDPAVTRDTTGVPMTSSDDVLNSGDPDAIREEIERTRTELSYDVDALAEKVNPAKIVQRRTDKVKSKLGSVKDKVMGKAHDVKSTTGDAGASEETGALSGLLARVGDLCLGERHLLPEQRGDVLHHFAEQGAERGARRLVLGPVTPADGGCAGIRHSRFPSVPS